jgi:predicted ester cyclase
MADTTLSTRSTDIVNDFMADVINGQEYGRIGDLVASDYVEHGTPSGAELAGVDEFEEMIRMFHTAFPDLESTEIVSIASEDGQYVSTLRTFSGTQDGPFMGHEATGTLVDISSVSLARIEDGKITERWNNIDYLGLLQQIDVVDSLGELAA